MRPRHAWVLLAVSLTASIACAKPPDLSADLDEFASQVNSARARACDCPELLGYSSRIECDDALGRLGDEDIQCMEDVLEGHEDVGQELLPCASAAYESYAACLQANTSCEEMVLNDCDKARTDAVDACPELPTGVHQSFWACALQ